MKTQILKLTAILGVLAVASACSATRTQESAGEVIDDSVLTSKVKIALIDDPITKAGQINVETYRGVVQLGGFVDNTQQKEQATKVARSITGVKEVRNDLRVSTKPDATAGQYVDDSMLTAKVKAKLTAQALYPNPKCGADFAAHLRRQSDLFTQLIRDLNIKTE